MATLAERPQIELRGLARGHDARAALLVLNGATTTDLRSACSLAAVIADRCLLVAVDGGLVTCRDAGRRPDLFVGDGDSSGIVPAEIPTVLYEPDKEFSDLAGALTEVRRRKVRRLVVAGLLGGRLDHEWANLQELGRRARPFAGILAPTTRGTVLITSHGARVATTRDSTVSLFPLSASAMVTLAGTRWELHRQTIRPGSLGLSNITGTELDLTVHAGTVALVFVPPEGLPSDRAGLNG